MKYFKADISRVDELVKMRIAYMLDDYDSISEEKIEGMKEQLPGYFEEHLGKDLIAFVAEEEGNVVATALLLIVNKPANPKFIKGRVGEVLNVYTKTEFRRRGIARKLMEQLIACGREKELDLIELSATGEGYGLYKKIGFEEKKNEYTEMVYVL